MIGVSSWRWLIAAKRWPMPPKGLRFLLMVLVVLGLRLTFDQFLALEPMVALLVSAIALKLLEIQRERDIHLLVTLGCFLGGTVLLFSQALPAVLYLTCCIAFLMTSLYTLNAGIEQVSPRNVRFAGTLLLQALPMMVVVFLVFPRLAPLWTVPIKSGAGITGMSDQLKPGQVAALGRSDAVAMRVKFDGAMPPLSALYWRGMVLDDYQDGVWSVRRTPYVASALPIASRQGPTASAIRYQAILEPTQQPWLYALRGSQSATLGVWVGYGDTLRHRAKVDRPFSYRVESWPDQPLSADQASTDMLQRNLFWPRDENPETWAFIRERRELASGDEAFVASILRLFREEPFVYTLEPGTIPERDFVDRFLWEHRRGFCEHYAYSFVVMMRMAGIPARIVGGYQGGQVNPLTQTVTVRQYDAHAWAEVWLAPRGWVRIDPTAAVSPLRVERGLREAMRDDAGFLADAPFSPLRFNHLDWIAWLTDHYDAMAWRWQSAVVGFDRERQLRWLLDSIAWRSPTAQGLVLLTLWVAMIGGVTWWLFRGRRYTGYRRDERKIARLLRHIEGASGIPRLPGEASLGYIQRVSAAQPELAGRARWLERYNAIEERLYHMSAEPRP
jgi:transglutaminase-like putative cysteine protease